VQIFWSPLFASLKVKVHTKSMSRNQSCADSSENSVGILQYHSEALAAIDSPFIHYPARTLMNIYWREFEIIHDTYMYTIQWMRSTMIWCSYLFHPLLLAVELHSDRVFILFLFFLTSFDFVWLFCVSLFLTINTTAYFVCLLTNYVKSKAKYKM